MGRFFRTLTLYFDTLVFPLVENTYLINNLYTHYHLIVSW